MSPSRPLSVIGQLQWRKGDLHSFAEISQRFQATRAKDFRADFSRAMLCAATNHADEAFEALDAARASGYPFLFEVRTDPAFDSLRKDPRYHTLLVKLHLES